jgi:RNA polymerase primary sigma factor
MSEHTDTDCEQSYMQYYAEMSCYGLLSAAAERELALRIQHGDSAALDTLVHHNLRLVVSIARRYLNHGLSLMELIQEGNIGLVKAAHKYDPHRNVRFSTHATWWIRQAVRRVVMERSTAIHTPSYAAERIAKINRAIAQLAGAGASDPTDEQIADVTCLTVQEVQQGRDWYATVHTPLSLDQPMGDDEALFLSDVIEDVRVPDEASRCASADLQTAIRAALAHLSPREQMVIRARFGLEDDEQGHRTLRAVGDELGVSRERIRQIEVKALKLLKPHLAHLVQEVAV